MSCRETIIKKITKRILKGKVKNEPFISCIEGAACSGKTIFASELAGRAEFRGSPTSVISIDDFCRPYEERYRSDEPDGLQVYKYNFDYDAFKRILAEAKLGTPKVIRHTALDVLSNTFSKDIDYEFGPDSFIFVEGIYTLKREFRKYYNYSIYLSITDDIQIQRAKIRDPGRGNTLNQIIYKYKERYNPSYQYFLQIHKPEQFADLVIDNSSLETPLVIGSEP